MQKMTDISGSKNLENIDSTMDNILVVAEASNSFKILQLFKNTEVSLMVLTPRIFIVQGDKKRAAALNEVAGISFATRDEVPESMLSNFDAVELLQIAAWNLRRKERVKIRPGDSLEWDAKGFKSP